MSSTGCHDRDVSKELAHSSNGHEGQYTEYTHYIWSWGNLLCQSAYRIEMKRVTERLKNEIKEGMKRKGSTYLPRLVDFGLKNA